MSRPKQRAMSSALFETMSWQSPATFSEDTAGRLCRFGKCPVNSVVQSGKPFAQSAFPPLAPTGIGAEQGAVAPCSIVGSPRLQLPRGQRLHPPLLPVFRRPVTEARPFLDHGGL